MYLKDTLEEEEVLLK